MAAGIVAYGTSQLLNVTIFSKLRGRAEKMARARVDLARYPRRDRQRI